MNITKGINQDIHPKYQEDGTYRFALNAVLETNEGEIPSISNELGNKICSLRYPSQKIIIGHTNTNTDEVVLFLYDSTGDHEIGIFNPQKCDYTSIVGDSCLNFSLSHPVNAIFKVKQGGQRVVYFTDSYNRYRAINIDDLDSLLHPSAGVLDCSRIDFSRHFTQPTITLTPSSKSTGVDESSSGKLPIGVYYFAVRYLDKFQNSTA
jgi:hypothetical protein